MPFLRELPPERGEPKKVACGVWRIVARNPGPMTYHGTNTYLIEGPKGFLVLDPGPPSDPVHVADLMRAAGGRISAILLSHGHLDHAGALANLRDETGAPTYAFHDSVYKNFEPDHSIGHLDVVGPLTVLHTPGHAPDHLCFVRDDGVLFSGDHVMSWSSTVVSPPLGDMGAYFASLQLLIDRQDHVFLPGHGPSLPEPRLFLSELLHRRIAREKEILDFLKRGPMSTTQLSQTIYSNASVTLKTAAQRHMISHLNKLRSEGKVINDGDVWFLIV